MNLTSQYIVNPKSRDTYLKNLATYKSIHPSNAKLRVGDGRQVLNEIIKPHRKIEIKVDDISFFMICCPKGVFTMGMDEFSKTVSINKPFLLGETEVTQELFEKVMGFNPSTHQRYYYPNSNKRPVEQVTWYDAVMFCNKLSVRLGKNPYYNISNIAYLYDEIFKKITLNISKADVTINPQANGFRLPLEKEWDYASKAGTNNRWAGTNDENKVGEVAWFKDNCEINGKKQTHPVKGKRPNEWGFYDMSGNVEEWCWDEHYEGSSTRRGYRGGGWLSTATFLQSANRYHRLPKDSLSYRGFRISASLFN